MDEKGNKRKGEAEKLHVKKVFEVDAVKCFKLTDYTFGAKSSSSSSSTGSDGSSSP